MSFTGLVGYCWASAPPHSTMQMSPSATANSLSTPSSSNDVAGKVYPNCRGKLVLATDSISTRRSLEESFEVGRDEVRGKLMAGCVSMSIHRQVQGHTRFCLSFKCRGEIHLGISRSDSNLANTWFGWRSASLISSVWLQ